MIDDCKLFDEVVENNIRTYDNIRKIATCQGDDYTTSFLLDYPYFKKKLKLIAMYLIKKEVIYVDLNVKQQTNFSANLNRGGDTAMFFIYDEVKESILDFSQGPVTGLWFCYKLLTLLLMQYNNHIKVVNITM